MSEELAKLSNRYEFILTSKRRMHQDVQAAVRASLLDSVERAGTLEVCSGAATLIEGELASLVATSEFPRVLKTAEWRRLSAALLWYRLWVDPARGLNLLVELSALVSPIDPYSLFAYRSTARWFSAILEPEQRNDLRGVALAFRSDFVSDVIGAVRPDSGAMRYTKARQSALSAIRRIAAEPLQLEEVKGLPVRLAITAAEATAYAENADIESFAQALERATTLARPQSDQLSIYLGSCAEMARDQARAQKHLKLAQLAVACDPSGADGWMTLAYTLRSSGHAKASDRAYRRAVELDGDNPVHHHSLGLSLHAAGEYREAIESFRRAVELDGDNPVHHHNLGSSLHAAGEFNEAARAYETSAVLAPYDFEVRKHLLACLVRGLDFEKAREATETILVLLADQLAATDGRSATVADGLQAVGAVDELRQINNRSDSHSQQLAILEHAYGDAARALTEMSAERLRTSDRHHGSAENCLEAACALGNIPLALDLAKDLSSRESYRGSASIRLLLRLLALQHDVPDIRPRPGSVTMQDDLALLVGSALDGSPAEAVARIDEIEFLDTGAAGYLRSLIALMDDMKQVGWEETVVSLINLRQRHQVYVEGGLESLRSRMSPNL
ncbi:MAG: tetratricopeptide repeat protein [Acidimicrobiia bacterium]|nr:tetratricopeptide repeat protein [Acidimicrobiia bacterium]